MNNSSLIRKDLRPIPEAPEEIRLFACIRNEATKLPYFFKFYRDMGVQRFFFVDNQSTDESLSFLLSQPDTHVFYTEESYAESRCGVDWLNTMLQEYGLGHWVLVVDADELFVYPGCEHISFRKFLALLESEQAQGVLTFLLDMYSDAPIKDTHYNKGTPFLSTCPYYDVDTYQLERYGPYDQFPVRGGVRKRLFWHGYEHRGNPPVLQKIPLVKWREGLSFEASTHLLRGVSLASVTGALLHFKLFSSFVSNIKTEKTRKEHWDEAAQYCAYADVMEKNPNLNPYFHGSARYHHSMQLVEQGLMRIPEDYPKNNTD